jgi:hypothetical protein
MPNYVTFDIAPHQRAIRHGVLLLNEMNNILGFRMVLGIHPTYKFVKKQLGAVHELSRNYLKELDGVTGDDTFTMEAHAPDDGVFVDYMTIMEITEEVKHMRKVYTRIEMLSSRGMRTTMRYSAMATRKYIRVAISQLERGRNK